MYLTAENAVKPVSSNDDPSFRLSTSQKAPTESKQALSFPSELLLKGNDTHSQPIDPTPFVCEAPLNLKLGKTEKQLQYR